MMPIQSKKHTCLQEIVSTCYEIRRIKRELHRILSDDVGCIRVAVGGRVGLMELRWAVQAMEDAVKRFSELEKEWNEKWSKEDNTPSITQIINEF